MPTFSTPAPISLAVTGVTVHLRIRAADRADTVVEVTPSDPDEAEDRRAAERTRVDYSGGALAVAAPKPWSRFGPGRSGGAVDVVVDLPSGSEVRATAAIIGVHADGRLGTCSVRASAGDVTLEHCGTLDVSVPGRIDVGRADGAVVASGMGDVRFGTIDGTATVENVNGDTRVDAVTGGVRARSANGAISIGAAGADVDATTANGGLRVDEIVRGEVSLETGNGRVDVGIRPGTAARLDVRSSYGRVRNDIEQADGPQDSDEIATVRVRTGFGDVVVGRPQNV